MMCTLKYTTALAAAALLAAACSSDKTETPLPQSGDLPICWDVKMEGDTAGDTRALIDDERKDTDPTDPTHPGYIILLSEACTPTEDGGYGYALGLFSDYTYKEGGKDVTVQDLFRGTRLVFSDEKGDNPHSAWNYEEAMKYWHPNAQYIFRAYYPQRLYNYTVSNSNAATLALVYPTRKLQYDLLIGCTLVNTKTNSDQMRNPVVLNMEHALAALRFNFKLGFEDTDWLTSVYLLNDEKRSYFSQGTLIYGSPPDPKTTDLDEIEKARKSVEWLQDYNPPATEELYKWAPPMKFWAGDEAELKALAYNPALMKSTRKKTDNASVESNAQQEETTIEYESILATAYVNGLVYENGAPVVGADGKLVVNKTETGELYARNGGWLLIIPQESHGTLSVCFTTKKGGNAVYKVTLPKETKTKIDKDGNLIKDDTTPGYETATDAWVAGKRYTYTITLSRTGYTVDLSIKSWNERKHSTEIIF